MPVVHHAVEAEPVARRRGAAALALVLALAFALGGCSGSKSSAQKQAPANRIPLPVSLVACSDWRHATVAERRGTVRDIRAFAGGPVGSSGPRRGAVLSDAQAYRVFQNECAPRFAAAFKLYKLYTRAAGFRGH